MTIYTSKLGDKKDESEHLNPEVVIENLPPVRRQEEASIAVVAISPRPRRRGSLASICVLLTALVVFAIGILGGIYLYNKLAHRRYEGWCGVSYYEREMNEFAAGDSRVRYPGDPQYYRLHGEFEEYVEIDKEEGKYEKIDVPKFADIQRATILHDFDKNLTAIVDKDNYRCLVIPLNRTAVKPPSDLWDLITKLRNGYYLPDTEVVREKYRVITPKVDNMNPFGFYIYRECRSYDTFRMVREGEPVALSRKKRASFDCSSLENAHYSLGHAGTNRLRRIDISSCL